VARGSTWSWGTEGSEYRCDTLWSALRSRDVGRRSHTEGGHRPNLLVSLWREDEVSSQVSYQAPIVLELMIVRICASTLFTRSMWPNRSTFFRSTSSIHHVPLCSPKQRSISHSALQPRHHRLFLWARPLNDQACRKRGKR